MIYAEQLTRRFGNFVAVEGVSLRVSPGTVLALLGPNGAGKTTTIRLLAGLLALSGGSATVAGYDVRRDPAQVRARVGLVTDNPGLYEQMTLLDYLAFFARIYGLDNAMRRRRVDELIDYFELKDHCKKRMVGFSKGMKQKVALARALLHEPSVLFLDEPTSGLDPLSARAVRDLMGQLKHASRTIVLCTHDLDEAERLADTVAIMNHGRIIAMDTPAALRTQASPAAQVHIALAIPHRVVWAELRTIDGMLAPALPPDETAQQAVQQLDYQTAQPSMVNPQVIARLVRDGAQITSVISTTRTLEDVYADLVGLQQPSADVAITDVAVAQRTLAAIGGD